MQVPVCKLMYWPSSTIIEHLSNLCRNDTSKVLAFWYFNFRDKDEDKQNVDNLLCSLIRQLSAGVNTLPQDVLKLREYKRAAKRPGTDKLATVLKSIIGDLRKDVFIVMDALDECPENARKRYFLVQIEQLAGKYENLHILVTSRREVDISNSLENAATAIINIEDSVETDVRLFVQRRLEDDKKLKRWESTVKTNIENKLVGTGET
jgi:hypothetical protein